MPLMRCVRACTVGSGRYVGRGEVLEFADGEAPPWFELAGEAPDGAGGPVGPDGLEGLGAARRDEPLTLSELARRAPEFAGAVGPGEKDGQGAAMADSRSAAQARSMALARPRAEVRSEAAEAPQYKIRRGRPKGSGRADNTAGADSRPRG